MFKWIVTLGITLAFAMIMPTVFAKSLAPDVTALDTIAGFGTTLATTKTIPSRNITLILKHSDSTKRVYRTTTDKAGIATLDIDGSDLEKAGTYQVYSQLDNLSGESSTFIVYPDEVSQITSRAVVNNKTSDLGEAVLLTVSLNDEFGNPIKGHQVTVIPSREDDTVELATGKPYTNSTGEILFEVSSNDSGVSSYSVLDVTTGMVLKTRPNVYYSADTYRLSSVGGDYKSLIAATESAVPNLLIDGLPESIIPNKNISFTVTARNADDETMTDYIGTVHISAPGDNGNMVDLPESDYTFTEDDLGTHTYSLGLTFLQEGTYAIEVADTEDLTLFGEIEIEVGGGVTPESDIPGGFEFTLDSPTPGTYGEPLVTLSGKAAPGYTIGFYDNDEEFGFTDSKEDGTYSFKSLPLSSGEHSFVAVLVDENSEIISETEPVVITIDVSAAKIDQIELSPKEVGTGGLTTVTIHSESGLVSVKVMINGATFQLQADSAIKTLYKGTIEAPAEAGTYKLDVSLIDELGNESSFEGQETLTVLHGSSGVPSKVSGLTAIPGDSKVSLLWTSAQSSAGVKNYRIYYGPAPDQLLFAVDTITSDPTWYIPVLENGNKYFFSVSAIDSQGQESAERSNIVEATPFATETFSGLTPVSGIPAGSYGYTYFPAQTGPEVLWLIWASLFGGFGFVAVRKR